ncbi:hypothetical protein FLG15_09905 [Xanthomonas phaseoli pv. dieffenbachiae]
MRHGALRLQGGTGTGHRDVEGFIHGTPGIGNGESGIGNRESGIGNRESQKRVAGSWESRVQGWHLIHAMPALTIPYSRFPIPGF